MLIKLDVHLIMMLWRINLRAGNMLKRKFCLAISSYAGAKLFCIITHLWAEGISRHYAKLHFPRYDRPLKGSLIVSLCFTYLEMTGNIKNKKGCPTKSNSLFKDILEMLI